MDCCEQCGCAGLYLTLFFTAVLSCYALILPHWWIDDSYVSGLWQQCDVNNKWVLTNCTSMLEGDHDDYLNPLRGMMLVVCFFAFISLSTCVCVSAKRANIFILLSFTTTISFGFGVASGGYFAYKRSKIDKFDESHYSFYATAVAAVMSLVCMILSYVMARMKENDGRDNHR